MKKVLEDIVIKFNKCSTMYHYSTIFFMRTMELASVIANKTEKI